jgi:predicted AlkP superfamily phosphohydrolase/phosphomutase
VSAAPTVLFIALDACDVSTVRRLVDQGALPNFRDLLEHASAREVVNPPGVFEGSLWASFLTSEDVITHGYWNWEEIAPGTYERRETDIADISVEPFWARLDAAGQSVAVVDVPHSRPHPLTNGIELCEWGAHDLHLGPGSFPPNLLDDVRARFGDYPVRGQRPDGGAQVAPDDYAHRSGIRRTARELRLLRDDILAGVRQKAALSLHLLADREWDLFLTVFGESHMVGHQCWHLHDPDYVGYDPALRAAVGDPVFDTYRALDNAVGDLRARADKATTTFVFLSHGMGRHHDGKYVLDPVLARLDDSPAGQPTGIGRAAKATWTYARQHQHRWMERPLSRALARRYRRPLETAPPARAAADRRWFQTPNNYSVGGVRFNVLGREPHGRLHPGAELEAAYEDVTAGLLGLVNVETGTDVVSGVVRSDDVYDRPFLDSLPDLFVDWNLEHRIQTVWSPEVGIVHATDPEWRTGEHTSPNGVLLTIGPGAGEPPRQEPLRIEEIGPTIAECLRRRPAAKREQVISPS